MPGNYLKIGDSFSSLSQGVRSLDGCGNSFTLLRRGKVTLVHLFATARCVRTRIHAHQIQSEIERFMELYPEIDFYWCFIFKERVTAKIYPQRWDPNHYFLVTDFKLTGYHGSCDTAFYLLDPAGKVLFRRFNLLYHTYFSDSYLDVLVAFWFKSNLPLLLNARISDDAVDCSRVRWLFIITELWRQNTSLQNNLTSKDKQLEELAHSKDVLLGQVSTLQEEFRLSEEKLNAVNNRLTCQITTLKEELKLSEEKLNEVREINAKHKVDIEAVTKELKNKTLILNQVLSKFKQKQRRKFDLRRCADFVIRASDGLATIERMAESLNVDLS